MATIRGMNPITVEYNGAGSSQNIIRYQGPNHTPQLSLSVWIYFLGGGLTQVPMFSKYNGSLGFEFWVLQDTGIEGMIQFDRWYSSSRGAWTTPVNTMTGLHGAWHHLAIAHDGATLDPPAIWLDGAFQTVNVLTAPTGTLLNESILPLFVGNRWYTSFDRPYNFFGRMKDLRIYNRCLQHQEVVTIAASQTEYHSCDSGLVFQGFCFRPETAVGPYKSPTLITDRLFENARRTVGIASYSGTGGITALQ